MHAAARQVQVRRLRRQDVAAAVQVAREAFGSEATGSLVRRTLTVHCDTVGDTPLDAQKDVLVASEYFVLCDEPGDDRVGLSGLYRPLWVDAAILFLGWFCVRPSRQGQGLGRLLLEATMQLAVERGVSRLLIETSPDAGAAGSLYAKFGFEASGSVPDYFGPGCSLLLLSRSLIEPPLAVSKEAADAIR
jgi:ribosomal protein S18 acetylase RimI-like enzyme